MRSLLLQFIGAGLMVLIVLNIAEAPMSFVPSIVTSSPEEVPILFLGDMMLGRNVELLMDLKGREYPFIHTPELFEDADFVIANLEGPIAINHSRTKSGGFSFSFAEYVADLLFGYGIHAVSLANNHTHDKGAAVYDHTREKLRRAGVSSFGHPLVEDASFAKHYVIDEVHFTLMGFNATFPSFDADDAMLAINEAKHLYPQGLIFVYMHWGNEYQLVSNDEQKIIAQKLQAAGANIIIGTHPHVTQEIQCDGLDRCTIFSLGNFIFDQYFSIDVEQGIVAYVTFTTSDIQEIKIVPVYGNHSQPMIMAESNSFLESLIDRSTLRGVRLATSTGSLLLRHLYH